MLHTISRAPERTALRLFATARPEIVPAERPQDNILCSGELLADGPEHGAEVLGQRIAIAVGQDDGRCAGPDHTLDELQKVFAGKRRGAREVHRNIRAVREGMGNRLAQGFERLFLLLRRKLSRCIDDQTEPRRTGALQRLPCPVDVFPEWEGTAH